MLLKSSSICVLDGHFTRVQTESLMGQSSPWQLLLLPVNHWPRACLLYTSTHKNIHGSPLTTRSKPVNLITQWGDLRVMRNVTGGSPSVFLFPDWPLHHALKCILPFHFPFSLSHREQTISRGNIGCAGEFFSSATDLLYTGVDSHFKEGRGDRKEERILF